MDRIDALQMLIDVAEDGSFSSVARRRSIATSTVTLAIKQLEDSVGARLMTRSTRNLTLTHEGEVLLAEARRIVSNWDAAIAGLKEDGPLSGPIRVTATNDFGRTRIRPLLDAFQTLNPGVHMTLLLSDDAVDLIANHVDFALRSGPLKDSSLRARLLVRGRRHVCGSPAYLDRVGRPSHPNDLVGHNCLILARPGAPLSPWPFREDEKSFSVKVSGDRQTTDGEVIRTWALEGYGLVLKNHWDIRDDLKAGRLETVLDDYLIGPIDLYAVCPSGAPSRRLAALIDFIAKALNQP